MIFCNRALNHNSPNDNMDGLYDDCCHPLDLISAMRFSKNCSPECLEQISNRDSRFRRRIQLSLSFGNEVKEKYQL